MFCIQLMIEIILRGSLVSVSCSCAMNFVRSYGLVAYYIVKAVRLMMPGPQVGNLP